MAKTYSTERPQGKEHFVLYPKGFIALRIIQLVLGIIVLGLTAYSLAVFAITGAALGIFTAIVTLISSIYILVAHYGPPRAYNYWAILGLDIFLVLFWLISFAVLASQAAAVLAVAAYYDDDYYFDDYAAINYAFGGIIAAAAGIGALLWVLYIVTLVFHSLGLHRHRKAGLHAMPGRAATTGPESGVAAGVPAGGEKVEMQPQQPQTYSAPNQTAATQQNYVSPQQSYASPQQGYGAPEQQHQGYPPQQQQQQQPPYYPQSSPSPSPIVSQPTGSSYNGYQQPHSQYGEQQPQELFNTHPTTVHEAPTNQH